VAVNLVMDIWFSIVFCIMVLPLSVVLLLSDFSFFVMQIYWEWFPV